MSAIENALLEGVSFAKKFFSTFYSLVFRPRKVLNSINPTKYSTEKFFNPFLFYVISTLPAVFIAGCANYDFNTLSKDLPSFFNNLSIQKIFLITLPYMVTGYFIAFIGGLFFKNIEWKMAYKSYIYYTLSMPLLSFSFVGGAQAIINHVIFHDFFTGQWEKVAGLILVIMFFVMVFVIPMSASWKEKWDTKKKRWIFFITPILGTTLLVMCLVVFNNRIGYDKGYSILPDDLICEELDVHHFTPEIRMSFAPKKLFFEYTLWFYNPTARIFWVPSEFGVDFLGADYYNDKEMRKKFPVLYFTSIISQKHHRDSLMIKPNQTRKFEYKCVIDRKGLDSSFVNKLIKNKGGYYSSQVIMDYPDILKNDYNKKNNCDVNLAFDSNIVRLWPTDSVK